MQKFKLHYNNLTKEILGKYPVKIDEQGREVSFYEEIPEPNILVDENFWQETCDNPDKILSDKLDELIKKPENIDELKSEKISAIKSHAQSLILTKYPLYKQINLIREAGENFNNMSNYIDNIRKKSNEQEAEINTLNDIDQVKSYNAEFNII